MFVQKLYRDRFYLQYTRGVSEAINKRDQIYHNCYAVCTFHKLLGFVYLAEFCDYLCRSSMFKLLLGLLKEKISQLVGVQ